MINSTSTVVDKKKAKEKYPEARVIVLDDNFNTFNHVANCLLAVIPRMSEKGHGNLLSKLTRQVQQKYGKVILNSRVIS